MPRSAREVREMRVVIGKEAKRENKCVSRDVKRTGFKLGMDARLAETRRFRIR
jgi:hypothetical protein